MIGAAGIVSSYAQNVYSVNVVGYITLSLTNTYTMIANQLDDKNGNYATNVFAGAPAGTIFSKYTSSGYQNLTKTATWSGALGMQIAPGEGVFVRKPPSPATVNLTVVGEVMQGDLVNPIVFGYDIYSTMVPQAGGLSTVHNYPRTTGDTVSFFTPTGYRNFTVVPQGGTNRWNPNEPIVAVGDAFWVRGNAAAGTNWVRTFNVQ